MTKEIAKAKDAFPTEVPEFLKGKEAAGRGNEDVGIDDVTIPRISIIQDLSPHHKRNKPEYIPGAETGVAFNTVSKKLYGSLLYIVPVYFRKEYVLWKDQNKGGGFGGAYPTLAEAETARAEMEDGNDYEAVDTAQHFVLVVDEKGKVIEDAVISMSKSQMKPNRALNTQVRMAGGDRFSRVYELSVVEAQNKAGQDYFNYDVKSKGYVNEETYKAAEAMYEAVISGSKDVSRSEESEGKSDTEAKPDAAAEVQDEF